MNIQYVIDKYVDDVLSGRIISGQLLLAAALRYENDKKWALDKGIYLDVKAGEKAVNFIQKLKHTKDKWAGKPFVLEPWQMFIVFNLFAWRKVDTGQRRFRKAYIEVARKNGKTLLSSGIALYMLFGEQIARAEVYSVATTREQAKICFNDAKEIVKTTALNKRLKIFRDSISYEKNGSYFKALSSDYGTHDGYSPYCVVVDEYHAHKDNGMVDVMDSGMAARESPMEFIITTAGFNKNYPCYSFRKNAINIVKGIVNDDSVFVVIHTLDENDDWTNPKIWPKANPNLNISVSLDYLTAQVKDAQNRPEAVRNVKTKNLNMWVDAEKTWILDSKWMECVGDSKIEDLKGCDCFGGLDLSNVSDITAFCLVFNQNGKFQFLWYFWIPEETYNSKIKDNIAYFSWVQQGYITLTPGNVIDYSFIKQSIFELAEEYNIISIAYDRWNSSQVVIDLTNEGLDLDPFGQGYGSMSAPTKELEKMVLSQNLEHFGNPVARWMMSNVSMLLDPAGNIKPDKGKSSQKIDGVVAAIMAYGEYMTFASKQERNPYSERGLRTF